MRGSGRRDSDLSNNQTTHYYAWSYREVCDVLVSKIRFSCCHCKPYENDTTFYLNHLDDHYRIMDEKMFECSHCHGCIMPYDCASAFLHLYQDKGIMAANALLKNIGFKRLADYDRSPAVIMDLPRYEANHSLWASNPSNRDMMAHRWLSSRSNFLYENYRDLFYRNTSGEEINESNHYSYHSHNRRLGYLGVEYELIDNGTDDISSVIDRVIDDDFNRLANNQRTGKYRNLSSNQLPDIHGMLGKEITTHGLPSKLEELVPGMEVALVYTTHGNM